MMLPAFRTSQSRLRLRMYLHGGTDEQNIHLRFLLRQKKRREMASVVDVASVDDKAP